MGGNLINIYDNERIKAIINQQFPTIQIESIEGIGTGNDCEAFLVNDAYVFKFPKHQGASDNLLKEMDILILIEDKLPVPTPKVIFKGQPNDAFPMVFAGYNKLNGEALTPDLLRSLSNATQEQIAFDLARFLRALHMIPVDNNQMHLIIDVREKYEKEHSEISRILFNEGLTKYQQFVEDFYQEIRNDHDYYSYKPCLIHNDLSSDHILYDVSQNMICGIIDFGDVAISDPDFDFLNLLEEEEEYGFEFTLKVLNHYEHNDINLVLKKFNLKEKYWTFEKILYGRAYGFDEWYKEGINEIINLVR